MKGLLVSFRSSLLVTIIENITTIYNLIYINTNIFTSIKVIKHPPTHTYIHVVNISYFQSCHFLGYQSFAQSRVAQTSHKGVTTVHSVKDR